MHQQQHNKSLDVRAKQRLFYHVVCFPSACVWLVSPHVNSIVLLGNLIAPFVRFNSLVTQSIKQQTFRQLNYDKAMSYKLVIARQLHKRMAHHYPQASFSNPYHFLLSTIIRDFGLTEYAQLRDNLRDVQAALNEMKENEIIMSYQIEKTLDSKRRNKLIDAKFVLTPDARFISEVIRANKRQIELKKLSETDTANM